MSASSSLCGKTVFLLDHSHWMREGSGVQVEIDWGGGDNNGRVGSTNRSYFPSFIPPVTKSLWTCVTETVLEYSRTVTDLFANERLLKFGLCEGKGPIWLNNWEVLAPGHGGGNSEGIHQQSVAYFAEKFGNAGPPPHPPLPHAKSSVSAMTAMQQGIKEGIESLGIPIPAQAMFMAQGHGKSALKAINKGRIICITSLTPQSFKSGSGDDLQDFFMNALDQHNRLVAPSSDHLLPILECEFILVSIHPVGKQKYAAITPQQMHEIPPILRYEAHVVDALQIVQTMIELCVAHHDLVSTVVTGIPMKEEQNAQHSSNYDVKLWHSRMLTSAQDSQILKWASPLTPKTTGLVIHHCTSAVRITPVDINGRPTTCLTSFLMNGRSVWLETLKKGTGKTTSNLLTSHGGEMWLHVIETARNVLEDPPSISEGVGGRVTDYRIPDFADLIRMNLLIPYPKNYYEHYAAKKPEERESGNPFILRRRSSADDLKKPVEMSKERLIRKTNFWPMTLSGSVIFPMQVHIESLLRLMPQDKMTDMEEVECNKNIWSLMSVEARGEQPIGGHHKKGQKREEQWKSVYNELENFIRANQHSESHKKVLESFLESRRADSKVDSRGDDKANKQKMQDMEKALATLESFGTSTVTSRNGNNNGASSSAAPITDSPASPPPGKSEQVESVSSNINPSSTSSNPSLLALWTARTTTEKKNLRVLTNTKLYAHLNTGKDSEDNSGGKGTNNNGSSGSKKIDVSTKA